jgi:hypothetical protein
MKKIIMLMTLIMIYCVDAKMMKRTIDKAATIKKLDKQLTLPVDAQWNQIVDDLLFDLSTVDRSMAREYSEKVRQKIMSTVSKTSKSTTKQRTKSIISPTKPVPVQTPTQQQSQHMSSAMQGIVALQEFRKLTPSVFGTSIYVNGVLDKKWLAEALKLVLNGAPLTSINKMDIQEELSGNATELIRELLHKDKNIKSDQWEKRLADVHNQVVSFVDSQLSYVPSSSASQHEITINMPSWISSKNNTFLLKEFEIAMLNYIFKKPNIRKTEIIDYFVKQIPTTLSTKAIIAQNIKDSVEKIFTKSTQEISVEPKGRKLSKETPDWIIQKDKQHYVVDNKKFADALYKAMADEKNSLHTAMSKKGVDIDKAIVEYFVSQLPDNIPNKTAIIEQIQFELELYWLEAGK